MDKRRWVNNDSDVEAWINEDGNLVIRRTIHLHEGQLYNVEILPLEKANDSNGS
jgi:hypothetical protein